MHFINEFLRIKCGREIWYMQWVRVEVNVDIADLELGLGTRVGGVG